MNLELAAPFLGASTVGLFGGGHLGRAIAKGLLEAGFPKRNLTICHRGSAETNRKLADAGLAELVASRERVVCQSQILLYLVRPQDYLAIRGSDLRDDCLLISFLAGVRLENLPVHLAETQRMRVMTSAPDTLRQHNGIAALYPADNPLARELLDTLKLRVFSLRQESDIHAFTALGPCLPIALTYWESLGRKIDHSELLETARRFDLPDYDSILQWAQDVQPRGLSSGELQHYLSQAATSGGVTDAILTAIRVGASLPVALERGVKRSQELAMV